MMRRDWVRGSLPLVYWLLLSSQLSVGVNGFSLGDLFGGGSEPASDATTVEEYGPVVMKSTQAVIALKSKPKATDKIVSYGSNSRAIVRRDGANSLFISFEDTELANSTSNWATDVTQIPFMQNFVYTAVAPSTLVSTFSKLTGSGNSISGPLTDAVNQVMGGDRISWITCTGEGTGGSLAHLCGLASALYFPGASVDVITFAAPWKGYNAQFSWAFNRVISLYYLWQFDLASVALPTSPTNETAAYQLATGLEPSISGKDAIKNAITIPNLPPPLPEGATVLDAANVTEPPGTYDERTAACVESFANTTYGDTPVCKAGSPSINSLGVWGPDTALPKSKLPTTSDCPPIICSTKKYLDMSCTAFGKDGNATTANSEPVSLGGLPFLLLQDTKSSGDAIVAWNETAKEAIFLFKFTNETRDWVADALAYQTDNFFKYLLDTYPGAAAVTDTFGDPQVHAGFYIQFNALLTDGADGLNLTTALNTLNGGQTPLFVSISGFSLGGGLSEIAAVWASYHWPRAHILTTTQGAPLVGNEDFVNLFKSTAGAAWKYQFNLDEVPAIPPLPTYEITREPIWITSQAGGPYYVLLQRRPEMGISLTTWYDHWCEVFYVPITQSATSFAVPSWVYNLSPITPSTAVGSTTSGAVGAFGFAHVLVLGFSVALSLLISL